MLASALRELYVARICAGQSKWGDYLLSWPTREHRLLAQEVYLTTLEEASLEGLYAEEDTHSLLMDLSLWSEGDEKRLKALPEEIDDIKLGLYKSYFQSTKRKQLRGELAQLRTDFEQLSARRHQFDHLTSRGVASLAKTRFLLGCSIRTSRGQSVFNVDDFYETAAADLIDRLMEWSAHNKLTDTTLRELARTDPWRGFWNARRGEQNLFGQPVVDYTDDQRVLISWSLLYDNVFENPDCPSDEILEDDDLLDGWLIGQKRERKANQLKKEGEALLEGKAVQGHAEVFVVADTPEDAKRIDALNDAESRRNKKQRWAALDKHGELAERDMPDTRRQLQMDAAQRLSQELKK